MQQWLYNLQGSMWLAKYFRIVSFTAAVVHVVNISTIRNIASLSHFRSVFVEGRDIQIWKYTGMELHIREASKKVKEKTKRRRT